MCRRYLVQNAAHLAVAGNFFNVENPMNTLRFFLASLVESKQGGILERKDGEGTHQYIG
jgi:hypothetical protein